MKRIGLFSDTHSHLDDSIFNYVKDCDEIWHAGDFGNHDFVLHFKKGLETYGINPVFRGVYGNIDDVLIRKEFPELLVFECEGIKVMIKHIGGYPGRYAPGVKQQLLEHKPALFVSGHSHILKIMYDKQLQCLHMNPGAAGKQGWHKVRTMIRFDIDGDDIRDCEVIELGPK